jgi:hypothetical protein
MTYRIDNQEVTIEPTRTIITVLRSAPHEPFKQIFHFNLAEITLAWLKERYYPRPEYYWLGHIKKDIVNMKSNKQLKLDL